MSLWSIDEAALEKVNGEFNFLVSIQKGTIKKCLLLLIARCKCVLRKHKCSVLNLPQGVTVQQLSTTDTEDEKDKYDERRDAKFAKEFSQEIGDFTDNNPVRTVLHVMKSYMNFFPM